MRILAVDDDPIVLDLFGLALSKSQYCDFEFVSSGAEALELLDDAEDPFGCFLLDINMPEMDGIELCERIREFPEYERTPIIMVTRLDHRAHLTRAIRAGASDYVVKPFDPTELITRIELAECRRESDTRRFAEYPVEVDLSETRLANPFRLEGIPFAMSHSEMIWTMNALPASACLQFCSLKIINAATLHGAKTTAEFRLMVEMVGLALSEVLGGKDYLLSHHGNGIINFVLHGRQTPCRELEGEINEFLQDKLSGLAQIPRVIVATAGPSQCTPSQDRVHRLRHAMKSVRQSARDAYGVASRDPELALVRQP